MNATARALLTRVRRAARTGRLHEVRIAWCDLHGTLRGKTLVLDADASALAEALESGVGMVGTLLLKDTADRTAFKVFEGEAAPLGLGAAANVVLQPLPESFVELPWAPGTGWLRAMAFCGDGGADREPHPADSRAALVRATAALAARGHELRCGLEVEFHIHRIVNAHDAAADAHAPAEPPEVALLHPGWGLLSEAWADRAAEPLALVRDTALALGLPLRSLEVELGPSQFEAVFAPCEALEAADRLVLFRSAVRQALRRRGFHASFCCKPPLPEAVASGWHVHQSVWKRSGRAVRNAFAPSRSDVSSPRPREATGLSTFGQHWLAGLLTHAAGMTALCAPTLPAYRRYAGSPMAPSRACWGRDNRGAMLRVLGSGRPGDAAARIENRLPEAQANPYLVLAAQIAAGLDGLDRMLDPPAATDTPYAEGAPPLPTALDGALGALRADPTMQAALGAPLATVFDTVKRQELARAAAAPDAAQWERREYFGRF
jgi:glutamine synthetase